MHVTLIAAQSIDGFITRHNTPGTAFTSPADKAHFAEALRAFDCSVMGGETYRVARDFIRARLTPARRRVVLTRDPARHVADATEDALEFSDAAPADVLARLHAHGHRRCALLGGAQVHALFLNAGLVDALWLTIEPQLFGRGTPLVAGRTDVALSLQSHERIGEHSLLLKYVVNSPTASSRQR